MVENPTLIPLLERLAAMLMPTVPGLRTMALCNIYWALGVLRLSPAGRCTLSSGTEVHLMHSPMQSCAALLHFPRQLPLQCRAWRSCTCDNAIIP